MTGTGATDTKSAFKTLAVDLVPYTGTGNVTFDFPTLTSTTGSFTSTAGGSNQVVFGAIRSDYTATVTYDFVPEPGHCVLLCVTSLLALRRRAPRSPIR